ncbi:dinitrogenase iron-molybdenum cofactor biosynthesis protein [candidate division KSB1 bacterium]|nr:MAG: dinitrogenase iron-molybdenum cofactor biosynthesis protein [candidate division KSB1 bacterium]
MKIAVTATGGALTAQMDSRFGRCAYFVIFDTETKKINAFANPAAAFAGGAGPAAARELTKYSVEVLITGHVGLNAEQALAAANIKVVIGYSGTVQEVLDAYAKDQVSI